MINPLLRRAPIALVLAAFAVVLSVTVLNAVAAAQPEGPSLTVTSHTVADDDNVLVVRVSLDAAGAPIGGAPLGALSAVLDYDEAVLQQVSCASAARAVCNEVDGEIHFAGFNVNGFGDEDNFLEVEFVVLDRPAATDLALTVVTAADVRGSETAQVVASSGTVTFLAPVAATPSTGGINGEVLDRSGAGVFGAQVCAVSTTAEQACTVSNGLGAFMLDEVSVGDHTLVVSDPNEVLPTASIVVEVTEDRVTTGISVALVPVASEPETGPGDGSTGPDTEAAGPGQIVVHVRAADGGYAVFGAEVCATMPVIGTRACGFSDTSGVVELSELAVGNYELTAVDSAGRFDPATPVFVGLNPGQGVNAQLDLAVAGLGEPPEVLAFVDPSPQGEAAGLALTGVALAALTAASIARRRQTRRC